MSDVAETEEKISQTVFFGSVYLALNFGLFSPGALMRWISKQKEPANEDRSTRRSIFIAYAALKTHLPSSEQYLEDGRHLIYACNWLGFFYDSIGCDLLLPIMKPQEGGEMEASLTLKEALMTHIWISSVVVSHRIDSLIVNGSERIVIDNDPYYQRLLGQRVVYTLNDEEYIDLLRARKIWKQEPSRGINRALVAADWAEKFRYSAGGPKQAEALAPLVWARAQEIKKKAPRYFPVLQHAYAPVFKRLFRERFAHPLASLTSGLLREIKEDFPEAVEERFLDYPPLALQLATLPLPLAAYFLGFPIERGLPNEDQVSDAIALLTKSQQTYLDIIADYNRKQRVAQMPTVFGVDARPCNEQDSLTNAINDYSPFDIFPYQHGHFIYFFTRPEFATLVEKKKNFWTGEDLPEAVVAAVTERLKIAAKLGLPTSEPLKDMWPTIVSGCVGERGEVAQEPESEEASSLVNTNLLIHWLLCLLAREQCDPLASPGEGLTQSAASQRQPCPQRRARDRGINSNSLPSFTVPQSFFENNTM